MPVFADYHTPTSYSFSYYYSPYSLSSRMSNALYSINPTVPKSLISSTAAANRPPSSSSLHHYYPSRPISIDATTIDVTSARLPPVRKPNAPAAYGQIHRGRTVIRLKMPDPPDIGGIPRRQKSPGRKLIEKFTIPERPRRSDDDDLENTAFGGVIRRHISANRRKSSLVAAAEDGGVPIAASRKSSITEELLKEEEAIFDTLIMEEIVRTNGVPDRRNSFDCLPPVDFVAHSRRCKPKRHSVDINAAKGLENSQSLNDFIEKLNADISRSGSVTFSPVEKIPSGRDSFTANDKSKTYFNWSSSSSTAEQNLRRDEIADVIDKKSAYFAKVEKKDDLKIKAGDAISKRLEVDLTPTEIKAANAPAKTSNREKIDVTAPPVDDRKTATVLVKSEKSQFIESPVKNLVPVRGVKKESHSASVSVAAVEVPPATNIVKPAAPVKFKSNTETTKETTKEQPAEKPAKKLESSAAAKTKPKQDPLKKQPKKVKKAAAAKTNVDKSINSNTEDGTPVEPDSNLNEKSASRNGTAAVKKSTKKSAKKSVKKKRKSIDWKMVDVGLADFNDEITEINGWSPEEDSDYTSEEESSDCDSDEESDESSSSESDPITVSRPYSYRHKIVHPFKGRIVQPASMIPRFKKYTVHDFNFVKVLGKGSFGKVLLAVLKESEFYYAVKCLKKDVILEDDDIECTLIERKVLTLSTKHPYLCHLFCTFQTQSHLFFVMEFLNGGDLMFHIQQSGRFDEGRARFHAAEIVSGLRFLHRKGIVYRDLKLDNILLDCNGHIRIADFGMCKLQIYLDKTIDTFCGTPDYMAPEIIKGLKYNQCVDWWSFGILLYEMLIGKSPFKGCDEDSLFWSICHEQPQFPRFISARAKSLLTSLLQRDVTKRLGSLGCNSGDDVMAHEFFINFDWVRLERKEIEPPYKPRVFHPLDTHYFDRTFTKAKPRLTPIQKNVLESMDQTLFRGFCYTNPNVTEC